jgi:uncharacterized protein
MRQLQEDISFSVVYVNSKIDWSTNHMTEATKIIERKEELRILDQALKSPKSEFLAVFGRRRVGKSFLISNFFSKANCVFFYVSGLKDHSLAEQAEEFTKQIGKTFYKGATLATSKRWIDAFEVLNTAINSISDNKKIALFFDEFPWMATRRSKLLQALDYYWNRYWVHKTNLKLIICGSSSSWIIKNVINNKAGLYNRVTRVIELKPFTIGETKIFLKSRGINLNNNQILNLYMIFGGIPFYLTMIEKGLSAEQCIDDLCFNSNSHLINEFENLFSSLFNKADIYVAIVKELAKHREGLGQAEIIKRYNIPEGGRAAKRLKELEEAGFITSFIPYKHQEKGIYYKVTDEFTLFYLNWVEPKKVTIKRERKLKNYWHSQTVSPTWSSWAGYAFEAVCNKHITNIRNALNIPVGVEIGTWRYMPKIMSAESGAQIDLLFDRKDDSITICEIKYTKKPFIIDKQYAANLLNKVKVYKKHTDTKKQIFIAMISANGIKPSMYSEELISNVVTLDDLFKGI